MNEPLEHRGIKLYQASYESPDPSQLPPTLKPGSPEFREALRPRISIFSVNRDPGRPFKYAGSILLVFGSILLFGAKYWAASRQKRKATAAQAVAGVVA